MKMDNGMEITYRKEKMVCQQQPQSIRNQDKEKAGDW